MSSFCIPENADFQYKTDLILLCKNLCLIAVKRIDACNFQKAQASCLKLQLQSYQVNAPTNSFIILIIPSLYEA